VGHSGQARAFVCRQTKKELRRETGGTVNRLSRGLGFITYTEFLCKRSVNIAHQNANLHPRLRLISKEQYPFEGRFFTNSSMLRFTLHSLESIDYKGKY